MCVTACTSVCVCVGSMHTYRTLCVCVTVCAELFVCVCVSVFAWVSDNAGGCNGVCSSGDGLNKLWAPPSNT